jgi:dynein intermediate chain 1
VCWQKDDLDENPNFISISSDGRVTQWTLLKTELDFTDVIQLRLDGQTGPAAKEGINTDPVVFEMAGGSCIDFKPTNPDIFLVGTEEGQIHKCSKAYNSQYVLSFEVPLLAMQRLNAHYNHRATKWPSTPSSTAPFLPASSCRPVQIGR